MKSILYYPVDCIRLLNGTPTRPRMAADFGHGMRTLGPEMSLKLTLEERAFWLCHFSQFPGLRTQEAVFQQLRQLRAVDVQ